MRTPNSYRRSDFNPLARRRRREYFSWAQAKQRCFNPKDKRYARYGGRGIAMCEAWKNSFDAFFADMGQCPPALTLERVNNDGHYEPGNCRWATKREQLLNQRRNHRMTSRGETLTVSQWAQRLGCSERALTNRLSRGWSTERAIETPFSHSRRPVSLTLNDVTKTIKEWAITFGIPRQTLLSRLKRYDLAEISAMPTNLRQRA